MASQATAVVPAPAVAAGPSGAVRRAAGTGPWLLSGRPGRESFVEYLAGLPSGPADHVRADQIVAAALTTQVRGRGGAGFPLGRKLQTVGEAVDVYRVVVANGEEGEPGSVKDRILVRTRPHLVLDGLELAGRAVGASELHVYVSDPAAAAATEQALAERPPLGAPVRVTTVAPTYVGGEESAVVRRLDGGPALPLAKPPRAYEVGVGGHPTVVSNVETLAHLALAVRHGSAAYGDGHVLVTLYGDRVAPALVEADYGTRLGDILGDVDVRGVLCGGLFGGLRPAGVVDLPLDHATMHEAGTSLGCAAFHVMSPEGCPVEVVSDAVSYLNRESSRQCGSCFKGTEAMAATLRRLSRGEATAAELDPVLRWSTQLVGRGNCALLDAACGLVGSLFAHWEAFVQQHLVEPCAVCAARTDDFTVTRLAVPVDAVNHRDEG